MLDVWTYLKSTEKPIVMYGTGDGADKIFNVFKKYDIQVSDIFVSDEFYREGTIFQGFNTVKFTDIEKKYEDFIVVIAFATFRLDYINRIKKIASKYEVLVPSVSVIGDDYFSLEIAKENKALIEKAYFLLADDESKYVFENLISFRITGKPEYLFNAESSREDVFKDIIKLSDNETYVDLGAYRGDTVEEFLLTVKGLYKKIFALEPDNKNYQKLCENVGTLDNVECFNMASWSHKTNLEFSGGGGRNSTLFDVTNKKDIVVAIDVDSILKDEKVTYIKMDVEGAETETLDGLQKTLKIFKPKLAVSAYHKTLDLFTLPIKIHSINPEYKIFLRHHPYIPDWESNYYCF
ncbi:MAG: FkbM family methyltransferase [Ruminococcaceae bacterium]|mgnify:CR=1 FL=1|nr:FkbM family methyltransferase [Oscillospiraceae bacterium]